MQVIRQNITQIYLLASYIISNRREKSEPRMAPEYAGIIKRSRYCTRRKSNQSILAKQVYAVFGPTSPKKDCPQQQLLNRTTVYGISKYAGEFWCNYYHHRFGVDVRSLRYPGLISYKSASGRRNY